MRTVYVVGVGMTPFGKFVARRPEELGTEAVIEALQDAGITPKEIQFAFCGHTRLGSCAGQRVLAELGMTGIEIVNCDNACSSGSTAFRGVYLNIANGLYDIGLALGVEKMSASIKGVIPPREDDLEGALGKVMPAHFAMVGRRHMEEYGTTREQFAKISVKNHRNGCLNPRAQYKVECTVEDVLASRMIADPLTLLQCCPTGDGAAAAILCSGERVKKLAKKRPVRVVSSVLLSGVYRSADMPMSQSELATRTAMAAYEQAGLGPEDVDVCELHDCFTVAELIHYENLGFCPRGEGGRMIDEGRTEIGGEIAVNPSGGLLAKGHPLGATGVAQVAEVVWQLRGEAGKRQVSDAKVGMTHTMGGGITGLESGACSIHLFTR